MARPLVVIANVIYDEQGRLLIGKHKDGHKEDLYAFPGGKVEEESCEEAFWRELEEETCLQKPDFDIKLEFLGLSEQAYKEKRFLILFYAAPYYRDKMGLPKTAEPHKHYGWQWLNLEELKNLPLAGSTKDFCRVIYPKWRGYQ